MRKVLFLLAVAFFAACSSAPKKPAEIVAGRNMAANQLDLANRTANQGRYTDALLILDDVRRTVTSLDDPPLLVKTAVARGNVLFSLGFHDEAFAEWEYAVKEAESSGNQRLAQEARIYIARGRLVLLTAENPGGAPVREVEEIRDAVGRYIVSLKGDPLGEAAGWIVTGMAEKELGRYTEAETALRKALVIHEKNLYLEEAAYDWYLIASVRSVSERYDAAVEALMTAVSFDRRAENGFGLASSWQALGVIYAKTGKREESTAAFLRAAAIYRALGLDEFAENAESKIP